MNDDELGELFKRLADTSPSGPAWTSVARRRRRRRLAGGVSGAAALVLVGAGALALFGAGGSARTTPPGAVAIQIAATPSTIPAPVATAGATSHQPSPRPSPSPALHPSPTSALSRVPTEGPSQVQADGRAGDLTSLTLTLTAYGTRVARIIWGDGTSEVRHPPTTCPTPSPTPSPTGSAGAAVGTDTSASTVKAAAARPLTIHAAHHWSTPGTYHVRIVLSDACGHTTTVIRIVRISARSSAPRR